MYYGIGFMLNENYEIKCLAIVTSKEEIKETVEEIVKCTSQKMIVRRVVTLPTEHKVSNDEARKIASQWWKDYSQMKIIDVLRGD